MEALQRLTRRQLETLTQVGAAPPNGRGASLTAIARSLRVSPPSALGHLTLLEKEGLVVRYRGKSRLTSRGERTLQEYRRHHRVAENLFSRLGLPAGEVCAAAREVDLAISHRTIERLCAAEHHPRVCPHGAPISPCSGDERPEPA